MQVLKWKTRSASDSGPGESVSDHVNYGRRDDGGKCIVIIVPENETTLANAVTDCIPEHYCLNYAVQ